MDDVTRLLNGLAAGDAAPETQLMELIYEELRAMAGSRIAGERDGHTLSATALVHEAYLRLAGDGAGWENRRHFFGAASEAMRRVLVDAARRRCRAKRGGGQNDVSLDAERDLFPEPEERVLEVHEALAQLEAEDPESARIVKLRYFVGLDNKEIAKLLDTSERTVRRQWQDAKLWLFRHIRKGS